MARINLRDYLREIDDLIDTGRTDEAIAHSRYILELYPKHVETYRLLGKAYLETQRYSDAADVLQRVLSSIPDDFISHLGMSIIREDEGNFDAAIWHMERAFEMQPSNAAIQEELRRLYGRRDGLEPTKIHLTRGALARMYAKGDLYEQAIAEIKATLAQEPQRTDLQVLLAKMYAEIGQQVESVKICSNILQSYPNCKEAIIILAEILPGTERAEEASNYHRRLQALDPYAAHISPSMPTSEQVPDNIITLERLEWTPDDTEVGKEIRPDWAASLGVEIATSSDEEDLQDWLADSTDIEKTPAFTPESIDIETTLSSDDQVEPLPTESQIDQEEMLGDSVETEEKTLDPTNQIPDFMQSAGWELSEESSDKSSSQFAFEDESDEIDDEIEPGDLPDWLQSMSPLSIDSDAPEQEEPEESLEGESVNWLDEQTPGATDSVVTWLQAKNHFEQEDNAGLSSDLVSDFEEKEDQLSDHIMTSDNQQSQDEDIPDWLRDLGEESIPESPQEESQATSFEPENTTPSIKDQTEFKISIEEAAPERSEAFGEEAEEIQDLSVSKDGEYTMEDQEKTSELSPEDEDAALAWLESLAAKQGVDEEELLTTPDERQSAPPDWVQQLAAESEPTEEQIEIEQDIPLQTGFDEAEDLLSSLESASADISEPEPSDETIEEPEGIPDWLLDLVEDTTPEEEVPVGSDVEHEAKLAEDFLSEWDQDVAEETVVTAAESEFEEPSLTISDTQPTKVSDQIDEVTTRPEDEAETIPVLEEDLPDWLKDLEIADEGEPTAQEIDREEPVIPDWMAVQEEAEETLEAPEPSQAVEAQEAEEEPEIPEWIMAEEEAEETLEAPEPSQAVEAQEAEEEPEIPEWITTEEIKGEPFDTTEPSQVLEAEETEEEAELPEWVSIEEVAEETVVTSAPSQELEVEEAEEEPEIPEWITTEAEVEEVPEVVDESGQVKPLETAVSPKQVEERVIEEAVEREMPSPINLNTASFKALERLPSIGPVIAQTIIDHRETHGFFKNVDSIQDVPGIGPKTLETLRDFLYVEYEVETSPIPLSPEEKNLNDGRSALESGNISKAYDHYSKLIEEERLLESVIDDLKEAQYRFPVEVGIYELLGDAYMRTDQLQEAIDTYTKAEELLA